MTRTSRWFWRLCTVAAIAIAAAAFAACGDDDADAGGDGAASGTAEKGKQTRIAYLLATEAAGYPQGMKAAAEAAAPDNNATVEFFDAQFDPGKQVAQCQDAIAGGRFDAIVTLPAASPPMVACARAAQAKDIPLIATNTPIGDDLASAESAVPGVTSQVLVPAETYANEGIPELLPKLCEQVKEGKCKIAFVLGVRALAFSAVAEAGLKKVVAENSDTMELVGVCEGGYQRQGGLKCMQDMLQKDPGTNVLFSLSDDMANGAEGAMKAKGKEPGKDIFIGTQGASDTGIANIRSGRWYGSMLTLAEPEGRIPVELAAKAVNGEDIPPSVDPNQESGLPLVFDQENKDEFPDLEGQFTS